MTRRLTNQDAFDGAMLHLLNQGHSCLNASGQARYRGPRGKSATGALIPDELYVPSMEGKKLRQLLAAAGSEYDALRERLGGVMPSLLDDLQALHDRSGACMTSLYRHLVLAGAQQIAQSFKLSMKLLYRSATYQHMRGPQVFSASRTRATPAHSAVAVAPTAAAASTVAAPAVAGAASTAPTSAIAAATSTAPTSAIAAAASTVPTSALTAAASTVPTSASASATSTAPTSALAAAASPVATSALAAGASTIAPSTVAASAVAAPAIASSPPHEVAATPTPTPVPAQLTERPEDELDLIARGIAKAIAAASAPGPNHHPGRR
jgi:hypothetical protein